jgi:hypothetical protein
MLQWHEACAAERALVNRMDSLRQYRRSRYSIWFYSCKMSVHEAKVRGARGSNVSAP